MEHVTFTDEQETLIKLACEWFRSSTGSQLFEYSAPAGAGKSLVMHEIIRRLNLDDYREVAPMCYTGTASLIMRLNGFSSAKTCHSWLYKLVETKEMSKITMRMHRVNRFVPKSLPPSIKLICVDEASMIPKDIGEEIMKRDVKVLVCGDLNQLPPVKDKKSFFLSHPDRVFRLTKIMRQSSHSSIVEISNMLLHGRYPKIGDYGDVMVIPNRDLNVQHLINSDIVICCTNNARDAINADVRLLKNIPPDKSLPQYGEKVVCRSNDWDLESDGINLTNGMVGFVTSHQGINSMVSRDIYKMDFSPCLFPDATFSNLKCDFKYFNANSTLRREMKSFENPSLYRSNRLGHKFELAYAITTHMSQGSQYHKGVFVLDSSHFSDLNKLCYTAVTRFTNFCLFAIPESRIMVNGFDSRPRTPIYFNEDKKAYSFNSNRTYSSNDGRMKKCVCSINGVPVM